jgi:tungstate transport system permease protein
MELIFNGIKQAFILIFTGDKEVWEIVFLTIRVSGIATIISMLIGIPLGFFTGLNQFRGKKILVSFINTGMGLPPVAAGLLVALLLWRSGPLGFLAIMYTPMAMIIAQVLIATPLIAGIIMAAVAQVNPKLKLMAVSLGAGRLGMSWLLFKEARLPALSAIIAGFGGVISEVGAVMMVGGNIKGSTRVLTTSTVQMVRMGQLELAIAMVLILLFLTFLVNFILTIIQQQDKEKWQVKYWK